MMMMTTSSISANSEYDDLLLEAMCSTVSGCAMDLFPNLAGIVDEDLKGDFRFLDADCEQIVVSEREDDSSSGYSVEGGGSRLSKWVADGCEEESPSPAPPSGPLMRNGSGRRSSSSSGSKRDRSGDGLSKNAIAARENRIKKKRYVQGLEDQVQTLTVENRELKGHSKTLQKSVDALQAEVEYLRGVLANVDEISALLKSVRNTSGLKVACNIQHQVQTRASASKRKMEEVPDKPAKVTKGSGICLHVNAGQVSLEFCPQCSASATESSG